MLRAATEEHARQSTSFEAQSTRDTRAPRNSSIQSVSAGFRNPLNTTTASVLNVQHTARNTAGAASGVKRTSSGLTKSLSGSFEDATGSRARPVFLTDDSPRKSTRTAPISAGLFDEDDFDSDIDLEVEELKPLKSVRYPKLPSFSAEQTEIKQAFYPTLPRQQQTQQTIVLDDELPDSSAFTPIKPNQPRGLGSSAPLPWSSSPMEPPNSRKTAEPSERSSIQTLEPSMSNQNSASARRLPLKTEKERMLPWSAKGPVASAPSSSAWNTSRTQSAQASTPLPKDHRKDVQLWNATASAVKEQQRQHREDIKRAAQNNDDDIVEHIQAQVSKSDSTDKRPVDIFLSDEQKHVLDLAVEKKKSVFFTGSAGTGKSVLMREIIAGLRRKYIREPDRVAVTASTGLAACNVGGVTLHSFAGIGLGKEDVPELVRKIKRNQKAKHRWMRTKVLVVDEVSMVDGDLFDKLEAIARQIRNNARPFGGIQLVITGDFFQLPPVPDRDRAAKFAFDAATWPTSVEHTIALHHVFRQKDPVFAGMLNEMREGRLSESSIKAFKSLSRPLNFEDMLDATELFPTRAEVDRANTGRLQILQGDVMAFNARDGGSIVDKAQRDKLLQNCMAPESITLKKGAQVMLIKNIDENLVNGSIGRVIGFFSDSEFDTYNRTEELPLTSGGELVPGGSPPPPRAYTLLLEKAAERLSTAQRWPLVRFGLADGTWRELLCQPEAWKIELPNGEVQASRTQIPLILAWSLSIHKAQGQTLERVKVDLGKVFEKGQAYVALSRATSMAGLQVLRFDPKKVNAHERVRTFYANLSKVEPGGKTSGGAKGTTAGKGYERQFIDDDYYADQ